MFSINEYLFFRVHGGIGHGSGFAEQLGHYLKNLEILLTKEPEEIFTALLPGLSTLPNIHPILVHFPIAFLTAFVFTDILGRLFKNDELRRTASWLLYLGTVSAFMTVAAGLQAAATVAHSDAVHEIMEQHETYGFTVAFLSFVLSIWRFVSKTSFNFLTTSLHLGLAVLTCIVLALGMDLGGLMVYKYGVGVAAVKQPTNTHKHNH